MSEQRSAEDILDLLVEKIGRNEPNYLNLIPVWNKLHDALKVARETHAGIHTLTSHPLGEDIKWLQNVEDTLIDLIKTMNQ